MKACCDCAVWAIGFNEQIFGADEQNLGRGQSDQEVFGPTVSPQLVQSGKGRIASNPALLNLPRPLMVGAFSVVGSDEQIFGVNGQILGSDQSDYGASYAA
jgi:hypothetical protein